MRARTMPIAAPRVNVMATIWNGGTGPAMTVGISGPLHRYLGVEADVAISVFRYGFYIAAAAIALALATIVPTRPGDRRRGFVAALLTLGIGVAAAWAPINWLLRSRDVP